MRYCDELLLVGGLVGGLETAAHRAERRIVARAGFSAAEFGVGRSAFASNPSAEDISLL